MGTTTSEEEDHTFSATNESLTEFPNELFSKKHKNLELVDLDVNNIEEWNPKWKDLVKLQKLSVRFVPITRKNKLVCSLCLTLCPGTTSWNQWALSLTPFKF
jgi:hypothetical protein